MLALKMRRVCLHSRSVPAKVQTFENKFVQMSLALTHTYLDTHVCPTYNLLILINAYMHTCLYHWSPCIYRYVCIYVNLYKYICIHTCLWVYMYIYVYKYTYIHTYMYPYTFVYAYTCIYIYVYTYTHTQTHIHTYIYMYINIYICYIYIYIYMFVYIDTHTIYMCMHID